ncbi:ORF6N domain-containing protein [Providencia rettgeri]|nr:ORF6N domain-containing protein [Providencia rettgeri]EJD6643066.1 ORF6N domain-containing protein [Providencia rettgeri]ELL9155530.1 ORF6N domain-containing protein [Providencia rettgeri]ELR5048822.1 ORF6N domain-containing protein [Providencia rettgeri]ELR5063866.1 ORF6N domain-containing protein [Providencia rettgeri]
MNNVAKICDIGNSVQALQEIIHDGVLVVTSETLAQLYGTQVNNIKVNYSRNANRFIEGKHYFKVVGNALKNLRVTLSNLQISPKARSLILWTERGAARHAKMLDTDKAWDVFELMEDHYFNHKSKDVAVTKPVTQREKDAHNINALAKHYDVFYKAWKESIYPMLRKMESPLAGKLVDRFQDGYAFTMILKREFNERLLNGEVPRLF